MQPSQAPRGAVVSDGEKDDRIHDLGARRNTLSVFQAVKVCGFTLTRSH